MPPVYPLSSVEERVRLWYYGSGFVRYFIAADPNFDPRKFRPEDFRTRVEYISALMDSTDPDLSRFAARSGKLIASQCGFIGAEAGDSPTRAVEPRDDAAGDRVAHCSQRRSGLSASLPLDGNGRRGRAYHDDVGLQADQLLRE